MPTRPLCARRWSWRAGWPGGAGAPSRWSWGRCWNWGPRVQDCTRRRRPRSRRPRRTSWPRSARSSPRSRPIAACWASGCSPRRTPRRSGRSSRPPYREMRSCCSRHRAASRWSACCAASPSPRLRGRERALSPARAVREEAHPVQSVQLHHLPRRRRGGDGADRGVRAGALDHPGAARAQGGAGPPRPVETGRAGELRAGAGDLPGAVAVRAGFRDLHPSAALQVLVPRAPLAVLHRVRHLRGDRELQLGQPHRRARWARHRADRHCRRGVRCVRVRVRPCRLVPLPRHHVPARRRRARDLLRGADGRGARLSLVQRPSRSGHHGRHGRPGRRGRARDRRHHAEGGVPVAHRGRCVRGRNAVGVDSGVRVPLEQAAARQGIRGRPQGLPHGPVAPPLREAGLGRAAGGDAVLHPRRAVRRDRPRDAEGAMIPDAWRRGEVAVVGLGKSGVAATTLLARERVRVYASDGAEQPYGGGAALAALRALPGVTVEVGRHDLERIRAAAAVVTSPGIPPGAPPLAAARAAGVPIVSELDLGFRVLRGTGVRCIAVTGTNGKTTTTALVAHLLRTAGLRAEAAGNIGRPLADVALAPQRWQWLAVEVSSFQLHDSPQFAPDVGVLTNLAPDHLDRYPSVDAYYADKRLLFRNAAAGSVWVLNGDDPPALALAAGAPPPAPRVLLPPPPPPGDDAPPRALRLGAARPPRRRRLLPPG